MELLTGKCKEAAVIYIKSKYWRNSTSDNVIAAFIVSLPETCKRALLMEFFDSVGIYIDIDHEFGEDWTFTIDLNKTGHSGDGKCYYSRPEATKAALIHANDLFNDKH